MMGIKPTTGCVVLPGAIISATGKRKLTLEGGSIVEPLAEVVANYICYYLLSSLFGIALVMPLYSTARPNDRTKPTDQA